MIRTKWLLLYKLNPSSNQYGTMTIHSKCKDPRLQINGFSIHFHIQQFLTSKEDKTMEATTFFMHIILPSHLGVCFQDFEEEKPKSPTKCNTSTSHHRPSSLHTTTTSSDSTQILSKMWSNIFSPVWQPPCGGGVINNPGGGMLHQEWHCAGEPASVHHRQGHRLRIQQHCWMSMPLMATTGAIFASLVQMKYSHLHVLTCSYPFEKMKSCLYFKIAWYFSSHNGFAKVELKSKVFGAFL